MCGIVGYAGNQPALTIVVDGLRRLEYRGYDSAGVAILDGADALLIKKRAGKLANLEKVLGEDPSIVHGQRPHRAYRTVRATDRRNRAPGVSLGLECAGRLRVRGRFAHEVCLVGMLRYWPCVASWGTQVISRR